MSREVVEPAAVVEAIFAELPNTSKAVEGVPDIVRKNKRVRAMRRLVDAIEARGPYPLTDSLKAELRVLATRWAQKGFDDAFADADDFEIRCAEERVVLDAAARGDEEERFAAAERSYLREVEKKYGRVEIRGLQLSARVWQDLEIAYVPLNVEDRAEVKPASGGKKTTKKGFGAKGRAAMARMIGHFRVSAMQALAKHSRLFLIGEPGSGKSTLLAYLATRAARGKLGADAGLSSNPLPFVVPVRSLYAIPSTPDRLAQAIGADPWFVETAFRRGRVLLLVDGLDEARSSVASGLLQSLAAMAGVSSQNKILVTTRPSGAQGEESTPDGFFRTRLLPMTREEVGNFIEKWCLAAELSLAKAHGQAEVDARAAADDLKVRVKSRRAIEKLAQTPLLCSVICVVHRFLGQRIPERRVALYDAITNVLLYEWDRAKFPEGSATGKLDAHAKRRLLARLALAMHKVGVAELPVDVVIKKFAEHLPDLDQPAEDAASIVAEIRDRNGVLVERSPGSFAFSHLTFQEYLAAFEIVNEHDYALLFRNYSTKWWHEVIVLAAGFPGAAAARIVRGLLAKDGAKVGAGTMLAAQCVETAVELSASLRAEVEGRVATLIPPKTPEEYSALLYLGEVAGPVLLRALDGATVEGKASILNLLSDIQYEPVASAIGRFMKDDANTSAATPFGPRSTDIIMPGCTLAEAAALSTWPLVRVSDAAFLSVLSAMGDADPRAVEVLRFMRNPEKESDDDDEAKLQALIDRYESAHPRAAAAPAPSPKRAARSG